MNEKYFYSTQSVFSDPGKHKRLFDDLPDSIEDLCNIVHGLVLQKDYTEEMYFFKAPQERKLEADIRYIEKILDRIMEMDNSQLKKPEYDMVLQTISVMSGLKIMSSVSTGTNRPRAGC